MGVVIRYRIAYQPNARHVHILTPVCHVLTSFRCWHEPAPNHSRSFRSAQESRVESLLDPRVEELWFQRKGSSVECVIITSNRLTQLTIYPRWSVILLMLIMAGFLLIKYRKFKATNKPQAFSERYLDYPLQIQEKVWYYSWKEQKIRSSCYTLLWGNFAQTLVTNSYQLSYLICYG